MVQAIVKIGKHEDRLLNVIKGKYGFKNKSDTINFVIGKFGEKMIEPALKPEYIKKLKNIEKKGKFIRYRSLSALKDEIENA